MPEIHSTQKIIIFFTQMFFFRRESYIQRVHSTSSAMLKMKRSNLALEHRFELRKALLIENGNAEDRRMLQSGSTGRY